MSQNHCFTLIYFQYDLIEAKFIRQHIHTSSERRQIGYSCLKIINKDCDFIVAKGRKSSRAIHMIKGINLRYGQLTSAITNLSSQRDERKKTKRDRRFRLQQTYKNSEFQTDVPLQPKEYMLHCHFQYRGGACLYFTKSVT